MTKLRSSGLCFWAAVSLLLWSAGTTLYAEPTIRIVPLVRDDHVLVSFELADGFTDDMRAAIQSGLRTTITYTIELREKAAVWVDRTIATAEVSTIVEYDNLTRRHNIVRTLDGRVEDTRVTENEAIVRQWLTSLTRVSLFRTSLLEPNREYYIRVRAHARPGKGNFLWPWGSDPSGQTKFTFLR